MLKWVLILGSLAAIAAVTVVLLAPAVDLDPFAFRAARAAALAFLSMMLASHIRIGATPLTLFFELPVVPLQSLERSVLAPDALLC